MVKSKHLKSLMLLIAVIMLFALWPGSGAVHEAEAATTEPFLYRLPLPDDDVFDDPDWSTKWGHPEMNYMNGYHQIANDHSSTFVVLGSWSGDLAYCVQPGVDIPYNVTYTDQSEDSYWRSAADQNPNLSKEDIKIYIGRILLYGYSGPLRHLRQDGTYSNGWYAYVVPGVFNEHDLDCMGKAWATQYLIWETIIGERDEDFNHISGPAGLNEVLDLMNPNHPAYSRMTYWYNTIVESVKQHRVVPSFASTRAATAVTHTMTWDGSQYSITLTDANGVLESYPFSDDSGITCSQSGDTITFSSPVPITEPVTLTTKRTGLSRGSALVWAADNSQDTTIMTGTVEDPVPAYVKLQTEAVGSVRIIKTSEDGNVAGISFTVTGPNGFSAEVETDETGSFLLDNLAAGTYTVTETVPFGYKAQDPKTVTVSAGQTAEVSFENILGRASLLIVKRDDETLLTLEGAGYRLYDENMNQVAEGYTARRGRLTFSNLPLGNYFFQEFSPPPGYVLDDTIYRVSLDTDGVTVTRIQRNVAVSGSITVRKVNAAGTPLPGVEFLLQFSSDGTVWSDVSAKTTDEDGTASWEDLSPGSRYRIVELRTNAGSSLMSGPVWEGVLESETPDITVTAVNSQIMTLPFTGSRTMMIHMSLAMLALCAGIYFINHYKEETNV